jgi:hypothetical protein
MCMTIYSAAPALHSGVVPICQLSDVSPDEALEALHTSGIAAVAGPGDSSITIIGYNREAALLVRDYRLYGRAHMPLSSRYLEKLRSRKL